MRSTPDSGFIYLVSSGDTVKIGHTFDAPFKRFKSLQAQSPVPLTLDAVMPGSLADEAALHKRYRRSRTHYEWFRYSNAIRALRDRILNEWGLPDERSGVPDFLLALAREDVEEKAPARPRRVNPDHVRHRVASYEKRGKTVPAPLLRAVAQADYNLHQQLPPPPGKTAA